MERDCLYASLTFFIEYVMANSMLKFRVPTLANIAAVIHLPDLGMVVNDRLLWMRGREDR